MKTYIINGQKVFDYSAKPEPPPIPPVSSWEAKMLGTAFDPAVGESKTVVTSEQIQKLFEQEAHRVHRSAEQIEAEHKAKYNWDSLNAAIVELTRAKATVHDIADQLLWEHEGPFYSYAAFGGGGHDSSYYADGTEWAERRAFLTKLVQDTERDEPVQPAKQKRRTLVKRLHTWWTTR